MYLSSHKQPRGFSIFFLTEMWERYGFYVIQTLLVFYLTSKLKLDDNTAYVIMGSFTALAYINSIFGGLIADKLTNYQSALILGGLLLFCGYAIVGIANNASILIIGLAFITVGTGLLKPNVSSMLSILYDPNNNSYKDSGYTLYYVGIYVGALGGSLLGGYFQKWFGWSAAFFSASIGMCFALAVFIYGKKKFKLKDPRRPQASLSDHIKALGAVAILILVSGAILRSEILSLLYFALIAIFCFAVIFYCIFTHNGKQRVKLIAFLLLVILSSFYWAIYFQQFFSISLSTERLVDLSQLSIPVSSITSTESLGVILFGPLITFIWFYLSDKNKDLSIPAKFSLGFLFNAFCFLLLAGGLWYCTMMNLSLSIWVIVGGYLLVSIGELCISPTSLSMVTTLVPEKLTSVMMGISLLSIGFGGKIAGLLASDSVLKKNQNYTILEMQEIYRDSFFLYFLISCATFMAALLLMKYINKLIK